MGCTSLNSKPIIRTMKITLYTISLLALGSVALAEPVVQNQGSIEQSGIYSRNWITSQDTTAAYDSINSDGVNINHVQYKGTGVLNVEVGSINAGSGDVHISSYQGDIKLGDVQANRIDVSTNEGNITLTGAITARDNTSGIYIARDTGTAGGNIILDGATLTNIELSSTMWNESWQQVVAGSIEITGDTTISGAFLQVDTINVAEGTNLVLENTVFASRGATSPENPDATPTYANLSLGDNVTMTIKGDQPMEVSSLSVGTGVSFIVELSNEDFANLDDSQFYLFNAEKGNIDLSLVDFTFTNGTETKGGTISVGSDGSITVTDTYSIPEPATATLSLLALCGLATRRRRK